MRRSIFEPRGNVNVLPANVMGRTNSQARHFAAGAASAGQSQGAWASGSQLMAFPVHRSVSYLAVLNMRFSSDGRSVRCECYVADQGGMGDRPSTRDYPATTLRITATVLSMASLSICQCLARRILPTYAMTARMPVVSHARSEELHMYKSIRRLPIASCIAAACLVRVPNLEYTPATPEILDKVARTRSLPTAMAIGSGP